jgi:DNA-directed RNA polymerase II subunit RPB1
MVSVFRHGINNDDIGPIAKASFEETPEMFLKAARHGELDPMRGVSANVMCGQEGYFGTNAFQIVLDTEEISKITAENVNLVDTAKEIESKFAGIGNTDDPCSIANLNITNNVENITAEDMGTGDDDYDAGF